MDFTVKYLLEKLSFAGLISQRTTVAIRDFDSADVKIFSAYEYCYMFSSFWDCHVVLFSWQEANIIYIDVDID